jgi:N-acetylmuramoyl-L-alanine amidase
LTTGVAQGILLLALLVFPAQARLGVLGGQPDWRVLDGCQGALTAEEFKSRVPLYSADGALYQYLTVSGEKAELFADRAKSVKLWELYFARKPAANAVATNLPAVAANGDQPLAGLRICLDPGHIGGDWADMEERHFRIRGGPWVDEAELNFETCKWIDQGLKEAGATVYWTKRLGVPVTPKRPADFVTQAITLMWRQDEKKASRLASNGLLKLLQWYEELIFYRVAEIQARAEVIRELRPDLTLCVHYNAFGWSKRGPRLYQNVNRIVIFVHGGYLASELEFDDMKFGLFRKLLENSSGTERRVADAIAQQVMKVWRYPPEQYGNGSPTASAAAAGKTPYVWSRNLLSNRLYPGPVVFTEGPFMDDALMYRRIIAGDYDGEREIAGTMYRSIYREYAEIVVQGVIDAYGKK